MTLKTSRKGFLQSSLLGLGGCAFSPYAIGANLTAQNQSPKRFVFIRKSNGLQPKELALPTFSNAMRDKDLNKEALEVDLDQHELPTYLQDLNDYKEHMTILQGMSSKVAMNGHFVWQSIMGLFKAKGGSVNALTRASIDYELAKLFPSPLGHVELSFADDRRGIVPGYSVPSPYQKNFCYADPITAFENLFQCVLDPSVVNLNNDMYAHIQKREGEKLLDKRGTDENAFRHHIQSIEAIQTKNHELMKMAATVAKHMPDKDMIYAKGKTNSTSIKRQEAMTDILVAILQSGLTNVVTYTIDNLITRQTGIPGNEKDVVDLHAIGHNKSFSGISSNRLREKIRVHHMAQVKTIVEKLKAQPEGNGTMFDNTMVMYFPEGGEKHHGNGIESPWIVMSGKNCNLDIAGRYIRMPLHATEGHQTLGNWYTTLLNAHGNDIAHYGDLDPTMSRARLPQTGAIKRFLI